MRNIALLLLMGGMEIGCGSFVLDFLPPWRRLPPGPRPAYTDVHPAFAGSCKSTESECREVFNLPGKREEPFCPGGAIDQQHCDCEKVVGVCEISDDQGNLQRVLFYSPAYDESTAREKCLGRLNVFKTVVQCYGMPNN